MKLKETEVKLFCEVIYRWFKLRIYTFHDVTRLWNRITKFYQRKLNCNFCGSWRTDRLPITLVQVKIDKIIVLLSDNARLLEFSLNYALIYVSACQLARSEYSFLLWYLIIFQNETQKIGKFSYFTMYTCNFFLKSKKSCYIYRYWRNIL